MNKSAARKIKRILWATDFSKESTLCLPYIKYFTDTLNSRNWSLYVLPKFSDWVYESSLFANEDLLKEVEKAKKKAQTKINTYSKKHGIAFKSVIVEGVASEEILNLATKNDIQMIFAGRRGISELEQLLIGSTTSRLIRNSGVPVFVVPEAKRRAEVKRILVPVDFNSQALLELKYGISLAKQLKAKIDVLHVSQFFNYRVPVLERDKLVADIKGKIQSVAKSSQYTIDNIFFEIGEPAKKIIEVSRREKTDVIAMGSHQRSGIEKLFLGSVVEKVLLVSEIPLLVLPYSYLTS